MKAEGVIAGEPTHFTIEVQSSSSGDVESFLVDPNGRKMQLEATSSADSPNKYISKYTASCEGYHTVIVKLNGKEVASSPYRVGVTAPMGDPSQVTAYGPGLEADGVMVNKMTYFDIDATGAGRGDPEVIILDANGNKATSTVNLRPRSDDDTVEDQYRSSMKNGAANGRRDSRSNGVKGYGGSNGHSHSNGSSSPEVHRVEYTTTTLGLHSVNVFYAGKPIPGSPFGVKIAPASNARRVKASGRGLQPTGVRIGDDADFKVVTKGAGEGDLTVKVIGPGGMPVAVDEESIDSYTTRYVYRPRTEGKHVVMISYGGTEIPRSPYQVGVGPKKTSRIRAFGPGLKSGVAMQPATFTVEANGETGALGFSIEGPSEAKIECKDLGDGSADVTYLPTVEGEYSLHILCQVS